MDCKLILLSLKEADAKKLNSTSILPHNRVNPQNSKKSSKTRMSHMSHISAKLSRFRIKWTIFFKHFVPYLLEPTELSNVHHNASTINNTPSKYMEAGKYHPSCHVGSFELPDCYSWSLLPFIN